MPRAFPVVPKVDGIDNGLMGMSRYGATYVVRGSAGTALVEVGTSLCLPAILAGLADLGVEHSQVTHILCTHVHMDHAGAAGHLLEHLPNAWVVIHSRSQRHLVEPERLLAGVAEAVGPLFPLYGEIRPADPARLLPAEGLRLDLGDGVRLDAVPTPGHSRDHVAYFAPYAGVLFTGDAAGVSLFDHRFQRPVTAPPHFSVEGSLVAIQTMRALRPSILCFTHFGVHHDPPAVFDHLENTLRRWDTIARTEGLEAAGAAVLTENLPPAGTPRQDFWQPIAEMNRRGFLMAYEG